MVEAWDDSVGIVGLKLSVDILFEVDIDEVDASTSVIVKTVVVMDPHVVDSHLQFGSIEEDEAINDVHFSGMAVDDNSGDGFAFEVEREFVGY